MADPRAYAEKSKLGWYRSDGEQPTIEQLTFGCLQRIATATEAMATYHAQLIRERDKYERWYRNEVENSEASARRVRALRGVITKLKRKSVIRGEFGKTIVEISLEKEARNDG